jgi:REP element-mobilizing transposase RayT
VKQNHWEPFDGKLWQRNYYEQIVRDETSLRRIREYIVNNPCQWQQDKLFAP